MSCRILLIATMVLGAADSTQSDDRYTLRRYLGGAIQCQDSIRSGRALALLADTLQERELRPADQGLTDYQLSLIRVQRRGGGPVVGLTNGQLLTYSWPPSLLIRELAPWTLAVDQAADRARANPDDRDALTALKNAVSELRDRFKAAVPREVRCASVDASAAFWQSDRFLFDLLTEIGRASRYGGTTGYVPFSGKTVCTVYDHLQANHLDFAPATPGADGLHLLFYEAFSYPLRLDTQLLRELEELPPPNAEYLAELDARWKRVKENAIARYEERHSRGKNMNWGASPYGLGLPFPLPDWYSLPLGNSPYGSTPPGTSTQGPHAVFGFPY